MGSPRASCIEPQLSPSGHQSEGFFCTLVLTLLVPNRSCRGYRRGQVLTLGVLMAGTSNKTTVVGVRVPNDTLAEWQSVIGDRSMAAYVLERAMRSGVPDCGAELAAANERAAGFEARETELLAEIAGLRKRYALVLPASAKAPVDPKRHHSSGPVLASAVPTVDGEATGYRPKASWKAPK